MYYYLLLNILLSSYLYLLSLIIKYDLLLFSTNYIIVILLRKQIDYNLLISSYYIFMYRDVKNICTRGYPRIKLAMGKKWILKMDTRYPWVRIFLIPVC